MAVAIFCVPLVMSTPAHVRQLLAARRQSCHDSPTRRFGIPADDLLAKLEEPISPKKEGEGVRRAKLMRVRRSRAELGTRHTAEGPHLTLRL